MIYQEKTGPFPKAVIRIENNTCRQTEVCPREYRYGTAVQASISPGKRRINLRVLQFSEMKRESAIDWKNAGQFLSGFGSLSFKCTEKHSDDRQNNFSHIDSDPPEALFRFSTLTQVKTKQNEQGRNNRIQHAQLNKQIFIRFSKQIDIPDRRTISRNMINKKQVT